MPGNSANTTTFFGGWWVKLCEPFKSKVLSRWRLQRKLEGIKGLGQRPTESPGIGLVFLSIIPWSTERKWLKMSEFTPGLIHHEVATTIPSLAAAKSMWLAVSKAGPPLIWLIRQQVGLHQIPQDPQRIICDHHVHCPDFISQWTCLAVLRRFLWSNYITPQECLTNLCHA